MDNLNAEAIFDLDKLYNYISIELRITDVPSYNITASKFRKCTIDDFKRNGL